MGQTSVIGICLLGGGIVCLLALGAFWAVRIWKRKRHGLQMDDMEGHEFEYFCAQLLEDNGLQDVEVTRGSGD